MFCIYYSEHDVDWCEYEMSTHFFVRIHQKKSLVNVYLKDIIIYLKNMVYLDIYLIFRKVT